MAIIKQHVIDTKRHPVYVFHWHGDRIKQVVTKRWRDEQAEFGKE